MYGDLQRVFADHFSAYRRSHELTWRQRWAGYNIRTCHTAEQGYHVVRCPNGHYEALRYNSCKHRSCPQCGWVETERWVQTREEQAPRCGYHHVIFTVAHELNPLWRYNRQLFANLMFEAAWRSLRELLKNPRWLGAMPGAIGAFQSWGETLNIHPHLHFIVTAGGLDPEGRWRACKRDFLLPARVLRAKFQGKFLAILRQHLERAPRLQLPPDTWPAKVRSLLNRLGRKRWNVRIEPRYSHPEGVFKYLAYYLRRGAIAESRIRGYTGEEVEIYYKRADEHREATLRFPVEEFIRRILEHVPPKGLRMVRAFGLFHHRMKERLGRARAQIEAGSPHDATPPRGEGRRASAATFPAFCCPQCGARFVVHYVYHQARASPSREAA